MVAKCSLKQNHELKKTAEKPSFLGSLMVYSQPNSYAIAELGLRCTISKVFLYGSLGMFLIIKSINDKKYH